MMVQEILVEFPTKSRKTGPFSSYNLNEVQITWCFKSAKYFGLGPSYYFFKNIRTWNITGSHQKIDKLLIHNQLGKKKRQFGEK